MSRWSSPTPSFDPLSTVVGLYGVRYPCPDLATVDRHIRVLCDRIRHAVPHFPQLVAVFRDEIDLLLDRRRWLELEPDPGFLDAA